MCSIVTFAQDLPTSRLTRGVAAQGRLDREIRSFVSRRLVLRLCKGELCVRPRHELLIADWIRLKL